MAGFGAACAAGRAGLKTLLVERQAQLGGMGTAGGVGNFCYGFGAPIGNGRVFDDVIEAMSSAGAIGEEAGWQVQRSAPLQRENHTNYHAILPLVLQRLARDAGVELLFCTDVVGTVHRQPPHHRGGPAQPLAAARGARTLVRGRHETAFWPGMPVREPCRWQTRCCRR